MQRAGNNCPQQATITTQACDISTEKMRKQFVGKGQILDNIFPYF